MFSAQRKLGWNMKIYSSICLFICLLSFTPPLVVVTHATYITPFGIFSLMP